MYLGTLGSAILCIVTIVGIPLMFIVILISLVALIMGITSISYRIGGFLQEKWIPNDWVRLIIGATLIVAFTNIRSTLAVYNDIIAWYVYRVFVFVPQEKKKEA
ncbi:hypothetical protein [Paenibacillus pabuli]|uniref:hypothetical protein n=1 Tax=Paenibacillus pabuli TaxID=1472 RepID=UPI001FFE9B47|nr:hypothetical protein [Paenibacillus pabuli]UPK41250.1 hypothetical protein KET34_18310 [Paenibacillus pabuli]